jgi:hypothetical protein
MDFSACNLALCKIADCNIVTPGFDPGVYLSKMMDGRAEPGRDS